MKPLSKEAILRKINQNFDSNSENGKIGYLLAWMMGVPASVLLLIFLIRGH